MLSIGARSLAKLLPALSLVPGPVYLALADSITVLVRDGRLVPDTRLPSERELATELGLSRATVTAAYDQLREHGLLASRTGAGSFITITSSVAERPGQPGQLNRLNRWTLRLPDPAETIDLTCAAMPAPVGVLERALAVAAPRLPALADGTGYDPMGLPELRAAIADRFTQRGVTTAPDQILITSGALHAFDLLLRTLTGPGDRVLTELPSYPGALDAIRTNGARVVPVALARTGEWDVGAMQAALRQTSPRLAYLIPDYHNPTGGYIDEQQRRAVLKVARTTATTVIIDESFIDLGLPPVDDLGAAPVAATQHTAALDSSVVTIGSLSKPVWGGLRIGWVRASTDLVRRLSAQRAASDMSGSILDQLLGVALFDHFDEIVDLRRAQLSARRETLLRALQRELPAWRPSVPVGGVSMWVELDAPLATPLSLLAAQNGVQIVPGARFGIDGTLERFVRVPYTLEPEQLDNAVSRLAVAWAQLDRTGRATRQLVVA
jgi:DNA-binding transcriptional MocR family regulator